MLRIWKRSFNIPNRRTDNTVTKKKKDAMVRRQSTNNDLQNTTQKTKDRISRNPFKTEGSSDTPEG